MSISHWEIEELARHLCGVGDDEDVDIDDAIYETFDCDMEAFSKIVRSLLPLAMVAQSGLSGETYQGFAYDNAFLVKQLLTPAAASQ